MVFKGESIVLEDILEIYEDGFRLLKCLGCVIGNYWMGVRDVFVLYWVGGFCRVSDYLRFVGFLDVLLDFVL